MSDDEAVTLRGGHRLLVGSAILMVLVAGCGSSGGDPGGRILNALLAVRHAVPTDASHVRVFGVQEPQWIASCSDANLKVGWSIAQAQVSFVSSGSPSSTERYVHTQLVKQGWQVGQPSDDGQWYGPPFAAKQILMNNYSETGKKRIEQGIVATVDVVWATPVTSYKVGQPVYWDFSVGSPPVPPVGSCGGG